MEQITVKINNFKLNLFCNLLSQSLTVDSELMLEFSSDIIRSCSFSSTKSFMKLWTTPTKNLIVFPEKEDDPNQLSLFDENIEEESMSLDIPTFSFYVLKGDLLNKYLGVHGSDIVDLEFIVQKENNKYRAASMSVIGKSDSKSPLITNFTLTTEDLITNVIDDYSVILKECTPELTMFNFILSGPQIQEIKKLTKTLHNSEAKNTSYLSINVNIDKKILTIFDKVFKLEFPLIYDLEQTSLKNLDQDATKEFTFNILKTDFGKIGSHNFSIYTSNNTQKVIFGAQYNNAIIWGLSSKVHESSTSNDNIDALSNDDMVDIEEYLGGDDLPF